MGSPERGIAPSRLDTARLVVFDFDGVFTDNTVLVDQNGVESVRCWRSDGLGTKRLVDAGVPVWILSTEVNPVVARRAGKLGLPVRQGVADKGLGLRELCGELSVALQEAVYVGNDINDVAAFKLAGWSIAVADAHPEIFSHVTHLTKCSGGRGAVREVCDWVYWARGGK